MTNVMNYIGFWFVFEKYTKLKIYKFEIYFWKWKLCKFEIENVQVLILVPHPQSKHRHHRRALWPRWRSAKNPRAVAKDPVDKNFKLQNKNLQNILKYQNCNFDAKYHHFSTYQNCKKCCVKVFVQLVKRTKAKTPCTYFFLSCSKGRDCEYSHDIRDVKFQTKNEILQN